MAIKKRIEGVSYDARSNFGAKGWWIIIFSALNWFICVFLANVSLNIVAPMKADAFGVDAGFLLSWSTPARILALFVTLITAKIMEKKGVKLINGIVLILGAASTFLWGASSTVTSYVVAVFCVQIFMGGNELAGCNMLISNWFPKKKGIAIGWATIGTPVASVAGIPLLIAMTAALGGIDKGMYVIAGITLLIAVLNFAAVKNYPEEWGGYPDNNPNEKRRESSELRTGWTWGKALKQKELWLISIGCGFIGISTIAFVSTAIPSMIMKGFTEGQATAMLAISSALGAPASYFFGWLDQRFGTQRSALILCVWILVSIVFFFVPGIAGVWIFLVLIGATTGATTNFPISMTAQVFGRDGSQIAFPVLHIIKGVILALSYGIMGQSQVLTGGFGAGYICVAVLVVIAFIFFYICNLTPKVDPINKQTAYNQ